MKKHFPGYYPMNEDEISDMWDSAQLVIDDSFLLDIIKLDFSLANELLSILNDKSIKNRLWIPYDVAWLYHAKVNHEIMNQINNIESTMSYLTKCKEEILFNKRFPYVSDDIKRDLNYLSISMEQECKSQIDELSNSLKSSPIKEKIDNLFNDKIGDEYDTSSLNEIYKQSNIRYANSIPPGYLCIESTDFRMKYHDMVIWEEMQKHAINNEKDIIFATSNVRDDWFYIINSKIISPRQEIINEFKNKTGKRFHCLSSYDFLYECCNRFNICSPNLLNIINCFSRFTNDDSNYNIISNNSENIIN